ncbi:MULTISPECIES: YciK family oxidoreductase [Pseudomonas]|uniref:YciK family oxidoreductase n=1 Tax=Pseudomonas quercus TaxID=2722792 RepID=A0ABX0YFG2_9PSED|nr:MULTISPECIES: YciK family oxidoreductase [Pseudomonas]MBF7143495.1 YciK family oxidoreductase [Pseudomonas sp. LY10J]NJP02161.1 YciK family oxidoreductase [Pseudomonas quercus]
MFTYQAAPDLLADRVILVTGAGRGIGAAAAMAYAAHGGQVILLGKTRSNLETVANQIRAAGHLEPMVYTLNLETATTADYEKLEVQLDDRFGRLDGLLHNASILGPRATLDETPDAEFAQVMRVNVTATFMLTRALLPLLHRSTDASVIFTSSSVGRKGRAQWGAYAVSKFATEGLMQTLADESAGSSLIRANSLNPGGTRTQMRAEAYPDENPDRVPTPEQIMPAYLYLMGPDSAHKNGVAFDAQ